MNDEGKIHWKQFDPEDESTHPAMCQEIIVMALKNGKPFLMDHAMYGLGRGWKHVLKSRRSPGGGREITQSRNYSTEDFDDIAWAEINLPSWWVKKEKES